ncbi:MAG: hypothetical protein HZA35_01695 [Parcubacteria group bacterium]|nr:hypothetical protein [Parcubacteria group bacterium]
MNSSVHTTNKNLRFGIYFFPIFIIGLLIILNIPLNLPVPGIDGEDFDLILSQSTTALNSDRHSNYLSIWGKTFFGTSVVGEDSITFLFAVFSFVLGFSIYRLIDNVSLRAPPLIMGFSD